MKNINQIKKEIKESGLEGSAAKLELRNAVFNQATKIITDVIVSPDLEGIKYQDLADGLAHIIEIFTRKDGGDFDREDFAEDLLSHIFTFTDFHRGGYFEWREKLFGGEQKVLDLSDSSAPEVETQAEQPKAKTLAEHSLQIMANKLSHVFASDKAIDAKEALQSIICEMANEANLGIDSPELIKTSFPLLVGSLEIGHARGFVQSIAALFDSGLVAPIEDELDRYHKRFDGRDSWPEVLDLSDSPFER